MGRVRYGLMLREDGFVLDDGTTARLGENHFLMTTTTAAAGLVMRHLDFIHQTHFPGLRICALSRSPKAGRRWPSRAPNPARC